jgi:hypothetical protein
VSREEPAGARGLDLGLSAFFVVYGLLRRRAWVRTPALVYAGAAVTNMFFYLSTTFLGPTPPPNLAVYLPFNLPWLIAPALLGWRMWGAAPFARKG